MSINGIRTASSVKEGLSSLEDRENQFPVNYAYDYLKGISYLSLPDLNLNDHLRSGKFLRMSGQDDREDIHRSNHAIDIFPIQAGLPWASGIQPCRQSKYWQLTIDTTRAFLAHLAANESVQRILKSGQSIAEIARKELGTQMEEGWTKFTAYMFAEGDRQRTRLLAVVNVFIFVFDDFWEMHGADSFTSVKDVFISRMQPGFIATGRHTPTFQSMIDQTMLEIREVDAASGNNVGQEMIEQMVEFFLRPPPPKEYKNMEEFLLYRHMDAGLPYVLSCAKFSLNCPVDLTSPRLERYIHLVKDHVSVANDLGSWKKEKQAFDSGKVLYLINAVDVMNNLVSRHTTQAAVAMTQALQLHIETEIDAEIERLISENALTAEEWRFVDGTLRMISGNVLCSIVMSRYGGEGFRLT